MATSTPPPSNSSPSPSSSGVSWHSLWAQRLWWLISALSGTLEIEADIKRLKQENAKLDAMLLKVRSEKRQIENETERIKNETEQIKKDNEQIKKDNERLAELESKIDSSFRKYGINLPLARTHDQP
jgi:DNA repair exonuclease SbcCD ATPase subunit